MKIATQTIAYHIACWRENRLVTGEALALPPPLNEFRMCVRRDGKEWVIDHYDSGKAIVGPLVDALEERKGRLAYMRRWQRDGGSKTRVVAWLIRYLLHLLRTKPATLNQLRQYSQFAALNGKSDG